MDKKSPVDVSSKLTDAFGSKGVVGRVIPDEELPTDAEGNRAEILDLSTTRLSPFPHLADSPSPRGAMYGRHMKQVESNPLGIVSLEDRDNRSMKQFNWDTMDANQPRKLPPLGGYGPGGYESLLTDDQKAVISEIGLMVGTDLDQTDRGSLLVTIRVPMDAGKTSTLHTRMEFSPIPLVAGLNTQYPISPSRVGDHLFKVKINYALKASELLNLTNIYERIQTGTSDLGEPMYTRFAHFNGCPANLSTIDVMVGGQLVEEVLAVSTWPLLSEKSENRGLEDTTVHHLCTNGHDNKFFLIERKA